MNLGLKGKSVLITGGSKGIGLACAGSFAAEGARLHLAARDGDPCWLPISSGRITMHHAALR